jgi:hypothetical protein
MTSSEAAEKISSKKAGFGNVWSARLDGRKTNEEYNAAENS